MKLQKTQISIDGLFDALSRGRDAIKEAAEIMVALADQDPRIYEKIIKSQPGISLNLLYTLERVGRGTLYDALLFDNSPGARRLLTMPFSQQKEYYEKPIKVVTMVSGKPTQSEKPIQQLTPQEVRVAFSDTGIRTEGEQVKVLEEISRPHKAQPAQRYEIMPDGTFIVHLPETAFTPSQLQDIYEQVKNKAMKSLGKK
jgi:hypothetical protein